MPGSLISTKGDCGSVGRSVLIRTEGCNISHIQSSNLHSVLSHFVFTRLPSHIKNRFFFFSASGYCVIDRHQFKVFQQQIKRELCPARRGIDLWMGGRCAPLRSALCILVSTFSLDPSFSSGFLRCPGNKLGFASSALIVLKLSIFLISCCARRDSCVFINSKL